MPLKFDPSQFVEQIGQRLVLEFDQAGAAGTPGLVGSSREYPARNQLEKLLPAFSAIGTGIVMDNFGAFSTQQDIVLFERDFCPVFSINGNPEATYFPVEGVIATGEVKSDVDKPTLVDALRKIKSAKLLRRFSVKEPSLGSGKAAPFRTYGNALSIQGAPNEEYNQIDKCTDQIFGFIICRSFRGKGETILENIIDFGQQEGFEYLPNVVISMHDGFIQPVKYPELKLQRSPLPANALAFCPDSASAFSILIEGLEHHAREGRTVPRTFMARYMSLEKRTLPTSIIKKYR